jgi:hypothetical protein
MAVISSHTDVALASSRVAMRLFPTVASRRRDRRREGARVAARASRATRVVATRARDARGRLDARARVRSRVRSRHTVCAYVPVCPFVASK